MKNIAVIEHPLVAHYLTILRDRQTPSSEFKHSIDRLSYIIASIFYADLKAEKVNITTPLKATTGAKVKQSVVLLPILRAGLGLTRGFIDLLPEARVSHMGLYRDEESLKPIKYYFKFPALKDKKDAKVIVLDPMIATGGSVIFTIEYLLNMGFRDINVVSLVCAPEGLKAIDNRFDAKEKRLFHLYTCSIDEKLNEKGYIVPGLGDAGDRIFGTI
ncbi:MAG: uracil phosphoribosyltransferase [Bacteroidetes bacterium]|nr:uracil phosphoribosyltransferase [Bacteroidota bacterium]